MYMIFNLQIKANKSDKKISQKSAKVAQTMNLRLLIKNLVES